MARKSSSYAEPEKLQELRERGWCSFEGMYDSRECTQIEGRLRAFVDGLDPSRLAGFGVTIFALASRDPLMRSYLRRAEVLPFMARALGNLPTLRRTGARISGKTSQKRIVWHHHDAWGAQTLAKRESFERLLFICYLGGTGLDLGPLIVLPRDFRDPPHAMPEDHFQPLAGEVHLEYPPGTVVVMDAPVLHSARRGEGNALRVIWGAHCQSSELTRAHPEDDPIIESVRVGLRHRTYRMGIRDGKKWLSEANRSPLPKKSSY